MKNATEWDLTVSLDSPALSGKYMSISAKNVLISRSCLKIDFGVFQPISSLAL